MDNGRSWGPGRWLLGAFVLLTACGNADASPRPTAPPRPSVVAPQPRTTVLDATPDRLSGEQVASAGPTVTSPDDPRAGWVPAAPLTANPFAEPVGNWVGGDIPRIYPLPDGRQLWWLNDSFLPPDGVPPVDQFEFVRNVLFERGLDGTMTMHTSTRDGEPWDFLVHPEPDHFQRFFWPLGGEVDGPLLKVFVAEMECTRPQWGICFRPVRTWLATFTWADLQLVDLQPAANDGVRPVYGFSVVSDTEWSYLFGAGGEYNTPTEWGGSDQTFVARVPRGALEAAPEYWDGTAWNPDAAAAAPIVERGCCDFRMSVIRWNGGYLGVAKEDEFVGRRIFVMTAPRPEGPWIDVAEIPMPNSPEAPDRVTYDAVPYPDPVDGRLAIVYSTNSMVEKTVFRDPSVYRPVVLLTDVR